MYANSSISQASLWWAMIIAFIMLVIYPVYVISQGSTCPRKCQCIWRDSKITVDCSDKSLAGIPTTVETNTQGMLTFVVLLSTSTTINCFMSEIGLCVYSTSYMGISFQKIK